MARTFITSEQKNARSQSHAVIVENPGKTVYLCGVTNRDADRKAVIDSFGAAARATFDRLRDGVESAGGTLADIVTMTVFLTDPRYGDEFVKIRAEYFEVDAYPASALVSVSHLADPKVLLEIQAIAVID